jgi:hypothetical protein
MAGLSAGLAMDTARAVVPEPGIFNRMHSIVIAR